MIKGINHTLPLDKAELIAFFLESLLYGVSALLFVATIQVLVYHCKSQHLNRRIVATSSAMMLLGTLVSLHPINRLHTTAFFTLTLATNVCCTTLIASRIWFTTKKVARYSGQQTLLPVVIVIVESGVIYSISCITILVVYLLRSNAQYPAIDGMFPIISIVFNLIIVRIALGIAHGGASGVQTTQNPPSGVINQSRSYNGHNSQYPMNAVAINVSQLVQEETDSDGSPVKDSDTTPFTYNTQYTTQLHAKDNGSWNAV